MSDLRSGKAAGGMAMTLKNWEKASYIAAVAAVVLTLVGMFLPESPPGRVVNSVVGWIIIADDITVNGGGTNDADTKD